MNHILKTKLKNCLKEKSVGEIMVVNITSRLLQSFFKDIFSPVNLELIREKRTSQIWYLPDK